MTNVEANASSTQVDTIDADPNAVVVPEDQRCKYRGKYCGQARARKSDRTFHRFCEYHRTKANTNQKRWTSVRRQAAAQQQHPLCIDVMSSNPFCWIPEPVISPEPLGFVKEDIEILHALLLSEDPYTENVY